MEYCRIYINSTGDPVGKYVIAGVPLYVRSGAIGANGAPSYSTVVLTGQQPDMDRVCDLNGDGFADTSDLVVLRSILLHGGKADLNGDGSTDIRDLIRMKKYFAAGN